MHASKTVCSLLLDDVAVGLPREAEEDDERHRGYADADEAGDEEAASLVDEAPVEGRHEAGEDDVRPVEQPEADGRLA